MTNFDEASIDDPTDDRMDDPESELDSAGAPYSDGLDTETVAAESMGTVTNDAVAGEPVTGDGGVPFVEAEPEEDESAPADDGYLAPGHRVPEEVQLDDTAPDEQTTGQSE